MHGPEYLSDEEMLCRAIRALINVVAAYEREIMGPKLTANQLTRIAETTKRMLLDEIHSAKSTGRG